MKTKLLSFAFLAGSMTAAAQSTEEPVKGQKGEPFEGIDQTWENGSDRRDSSVFNKMKYFTPSILMDLSYTYSFNNPNDNTVVGSTALARNNEAQLQAMHFGGDFNVGNARARFMTQFGMRSIVIPRNDFSPYRGQYQLANVYRYLSEAYAGYHINRLHGINIDFGMFMSYIGLNSYYQPENWEYQASFTSDNTPWFFNGMRIQVHVNKHLKIEPWIINGWQSYGKFNAMPGFGANITYMNDNFKILTNDYYGTDAGGLPGRKRFHSDNSLLVRYYKNKPSKAISQAAFSLTGDFGFEKGEGVNGLKDGDSLQGPAQYFASLMFYNRIWFNKNKWAWTVGGGVMTNPGRYLVLYPTGQASPLPDPNNPTGTEGAFPYPCGPGDQFKGWDISTNLSWMPNSATEFRLEYVHREATAIDHTGVENGYFAGPGGVTSPSGFQWTPLPNDWRPDLVKTENRLIFAVLFRL